MNTIIIKCPNCGAPINSSNQDSIVICAYCGSSIDLNANRSSEERMKIRDLEEANKIREQQFVLDRLDREDNNKRLKRKIKATVLLAIIGLFMIIIGSFFGSASGDSDSPFYMIALLGYFPLLSIVYVWAFSSNKQKISQMHINPNSVIINEDLLYIDDENYSIIAERYKTAGFLNIKCVPLGDLNFFNKKKNGLVAKVAINGKDDYQEGDEISKDSSIIISYHSIK